MPISASEADDKPGFMTDMEVRMAMFSSVLSQETVGLDLQQDNLTTSELVGNIKPSREPNNQQVVDCWPWSHGTRADKERRHVGWP
jgi:hypothetical protein